MSQDHHETDPLLASSDRIQSPAAAAEASSQLDSEDERMGKAWDIQQVRQSPRWRMDKAGNTMVWLGLIMFVPLVQYVVISAYQQDKKAVGWFVLHPTAQSLAITMSVLSIMTLQTASSVPGATDKKLAFHKHALINSLLVFPLLSIGSFAIIYNKYKHGASHFVTVHGKMGLAVVGWLCLQAIAGALAAGLAFFVGPKATRFYKYHRISGYVLLPLVLVTAHLGGAQSDWMVGHTRLWERIVAFDIGLALIGVGVLLRMRPKKMKLL